MTNDDIMIMIRMRMIYDDNTLIIMIHRVVCGESVNLS